MKKEGGVSANEVRFNYRVENPWFRVGNQEKVGEIVIKGNSVSAKQVYEAVEKEVGKIRVLYEIRPLQETRPLKKTGTEVFKARKDLHFFESGEGLL